MKKLLLIAVVTILFIGCKNEVVDTNVTPAIESNVIAIEGNASEAVATLKGNVTH